MISARFKWTDDSNLLCEFLRRRQIVAYNQVELFHGQSNVMLDDVVVFSHTNILEKAIELNKKASKNLTHTHTHKLG